MPQISPMKWLILSYITQSSLLQITSYVNSNKSYNWPQLNPKAFMNKMSWKW